MSRGRGAAAPAAALLAAVLSWGCGPDIGRVVFTRTGGIAGSHEIFSVAKDGTARVERRRPDVAKEARLDDAALKRVVERVGKLDLSRKPPRFEPGAGFDLLYYRLVVHRTKGDSLVYEWDDLSRAGGADEESTLAALRAAAGAIAEEATKAVAR
jgi:hypothetical protein